jgi:tol-pal system protein YbgF
MKYGLVFLLAVLVAGCASTQDVTNVRTDVTSTYRDFNSYRDKTDARLSRVERELSAINKNIGTSDQGLRKQLVDLNMALEAKDEKIKVIMGRLDELENRSRASGDETRSDLRTGGRATTREGGVSRQAPGPRGGNYEELYKQAFDAYQKGFFDDAIRKFTDFLRVHPDTPLVPNAQYWTGESYMNLKDYERAVVHFQEVIDKYPKSDKAPKALLRQAEAFAALGDKKSSTTLLKRVVELFPKSEEARIADRMLRSVGAQ